jgi:hypothetical protein
VGTQFRDAPRRNVMIFNAKKFFPFDPQGAMPTLAVGM